MAPATASASSSSLKGQWRPTKVMNMRDLSRDDDFLSHLLVEKLGTGDVPLVVHKMDPSRRLPKTDAEDLLQIVQRMVPAKGAQPNVIRQAVDELLSLNAVKYYLKSSSYSQKQINAFATHASRYFELYLPGGSIEIAHTSRYAHRTGKSELCILATRPLAPGTVINELKGSMADLTEEEDKELKRTDETHADGLGIRRDFSVIHSKQLKKNHLFLGPARFVNHDCDHNVELFREGRYITFRVIKPIGVGEEVTAHYGDGYFGRKNKHCLCASCERNGRGGYAAQVSDDERTDTGSGSAEDQDGGPDESSQSSDEEDTLPEVVNFNERRTRRGVYTVVAEDAKDQEQDGDNASDLTSLPPSSSNDAGLPSGQGLLTPEPEAERGRSKGKARETIAPIAPIPVKATVGGLPLAAEHKSVITTRSQKAREASTGASASRAPSQNPVGRSGSAVPVARQTITPPLTADSVGSVRSSSRLKSREDGREEPSPHSTPMKDRKGKGRATASTSDVRETEKDEPEARHLRPRISAPIFDHTLVREKKLFDAPRGLDGKPLPLCTTCGNVLPVISVNSEVVWGLSLGRTGKRGRPKKDQAMECPRCIRHFAIYGRKWPERVAGDGSRAFAPVIRDEYLVKKSTTAILAAVGRKPAALVVSIPAKRPHQDDNRGEETTPVPKKQKGPTGRPRGRPPKHKVGMSEASKQLLNIDTTGVSRSGRTRMPSMKMRESEPPVQRTRISPRKAQPSSPSSLSSATESPQAVRHQTPSPPDEGSVNAPPLIKIVTPKSLAVAAQPRDSNGRFGKKAETNGRFMRNRHFSGGGKRLCKGPKTSFLTRRTAEVDGDENSEGSGDEPTHARHRSDEQFLDFHSSGLQEAVEFGEEALEDVVLKRSGDSDNSDDQHGKRKRLSSDDECSDDSPTNSPRATLGRARGSLLRPNPISFARRKWAPVEGTSKLSASAMVNFRMDMEARDGLEDDGSVDQETHDIAPSPVAPVIQVIQNTGSEPELAATDDSDDSSTASPPPVRSLQPAARLARLTFRPSPMNLAKRRWAPVPQTSHMSETARVEDDDVTALTEAAQERTRVPTGSSVKLTLAGTELDDDFPFSGLGYPSDSEEYDSEEDQPEIEHASRLRVVSHESTTHDRQSPDVLSTDESEQVVEQLIGSGSSSLRPATRSPSPPPSLAGRNPASPPGYEWKKTVLMPSPKPRQDRSPAKYTIYTQRNAEISITTNPAPGIDRAGTSVGRSGFRIPSLMTRTLTGSSHSPSPLQTPPPVRVAVWESSSDIGSP